MCIKVFLSAVIMLKISIKELDSNEVSTKKYFMTHRCAFLAYAILHRNESAVT